MARIELSHIGNIGTLALTTVGTSGASTLLGSVLNIPVYQGQLTLSTAGTSGASTLVGNTLTIPTYQGALTLTTTGSGAATLVGTTLNIPTPVATTPGGSNTDIQYNNSGAFGGSSNLQWDNANVRLNVGAPSSPTARLNVRGGGNTSGTWTAQFHNSAGNNNALMIRDDGNIGIGTSSPAVKLDVAGGINASNSITLDAVTPSVNFILKGRAGGWFTGYRFSGNAGTLAGGLFANGSNDAVNYYTIGSSSTSGLTVRHSTGDVCIGSTTAGARLSVLGTNALGGTSSFLVQNSTPDNLYRIENNGKITYWATNTAAGTTGAQTINRPSGTVNFAAGATSLVVTNSLCTTSSIVLPVVRTADATAYIKNVVPGTGSFTIELGAAATAETSVGFFIIN